MKLKGPLSGNFDPQSMVLKISGKNSLGKTLEVSMPVTDPNVFVGWISAVLFEKYNKPDGSRKALIANAVSISAHRDDSGTNDITFSFKAGEMRLAFVVPVHTRAGKTSVHKGSLRSSTR